MECLLAEFINTIEFGRCGYMEAHLVNWEVWLGD